MAAKEANGTTRKTTELLIVTRNELGALTKLTAPLAKNNINIECFTGYEWGTEAAFRLVTNNNRKACDLLKASGYTVQENPVVLWNVDNTPGRLRTATSALSESRINTFCAYATGPTNAPTQTVVFNTSDATKTMDVLDRVR